jgi:hypothetical protein
MVRRKKTIPSAAVRVNTRIRWLASPHVLDGCAKSVNAINLLAHISSATRTVLSNNDDRTVWQGTRLRSLSLLESACRRLMGSNEDDRYIPFLFFRPGLQLQNPTSWACECQGSSILPYDENRIRGILPRIQSTVRPVQKVAQ